MAREGDICRDSEHGRENPMRTFCKYAGSNGEEATPGHTSLKITCNQLYSLIEMTRRTSPELDDSRG